MASRNLDSRFPFTKDDERDALAAADAPIAVNCDACSGFGGPHECGPTDWTDTDADGCAICDRADHLAAACPERHADDEPLNAVECLVCGEFVYAEHAFGKAGCLDCIETADAPDVEYSIGRDGRLDPTPTTKEVVMARPAFLSGDPHHSVMPFAYKADLIYEVMVTQRNEPTIFDPKIADSVPSQCRRCAGTGRYITGTLNGKPTGPGGPCFRCAGKGFQTKADKRRNWGYDNFGQRVAVGPAPTIVAVHDDFPCPHCGATKDHTVEACGL